MRKLGIIGGMSWASTALYYEHVNRGVSRRLGGLHSALMAVESVEFAEIAAKEEAEDWDGIGEILGQAAQRLEASGAGAIAIACNTVHKSFDKVASAVSVPMLHIGDAAADKLAADGRKRVALLGTRFTMTGDFIAGRLKARGIEIVPLSEDAMNEVNRIIFEELAAGRVVRDSQRKLKTLITELAKAKVEAVVLACTELGMAVDVRANVLPVYDTTEIHARACVDWMLADEEVARAAA